MFLHRAQEAFHFFHIRFCNSAILLEETYKYV